MLLKSMAIGRQSFYDTFGDKLKLYHTSLERYAGDETHKHLASLRNGGRGMGGIRRMLARVVAEAGAPCLGVGSICEFGSRDREVNGINAAADMVLHRAIVERLEEARTDGDLAAEVEPEDAARFVSAIVASIRISARGGASQEVLEAIGQLALRALQ